MSLVAELKKQGMTFSEIHASLKSGQRGNPPAIDPEDVQDIVTSDSESRMALEVERLQNTLVQAREALQKAQEELKEFEAVKEAKIKLEARLENVEQERDRLQKKIDEMSRRIEEVSMQAGREYAKGFVEGLKNRDAEKKDE